MNNIERLKFYTDKLEESTSNNFVRIGNYSLIRTQNLDDIYNQAFIEENNSFIMDTKGIPHPICETQSGSANNNCSSADKILKNERLLNKIACALIFIEYARKLPFLPKYKKAAKDVEEQLEKCFEADDFSNIVLNKYLKQGQIDSIKRKYCKSLSTLEKEDFEFVTSPRSKQTREELLGQEKSF